MWLEVWAEEGSDEQMVEEAAGEELDVSPAVCSLEVKRCDKMTTENAAALTVAESIVAVAS